MFQRELYIKPSVLQLDYEVDREIVSFQVCKSISNQDARGSSGPVGSSCASADSCPGGGQDGAS